MKKIITVMLLILVVSAASAQKGRGYYYRPSTTVFVGGYYPYFGMYPYYGYPNYYSPYGNRPSKLDLQIANIKHDYEDRIASVRMDKTLSGKERREKIRALRNERDNVIDAARRNYYKS